MKKLLTNLFAAVMLAGAFATACTEEETGNTEPSFPTTEFNEVLVGPDAAAGDETLTDEYEIKFTPNYDWTLSVNMENNSYFRLIDNGQERFSVSGPASETEISVVAKCIAEADFEEHSTDVYLTMNGIEQKIGRLTIAGNTVVFKVFPAVTEDGAFVPATDGTYTYKYAETAASSDTQIPMIWNPVNSRYETFVLVHSNLAWNITATSDQNNITYDRLDGTNPLYTELQVSCKLKNTDTDTKTYTFTATINDEAVPEEERSKTFTIATPRFVPELSVYLARTSDGGFEWSSDGNTRYVYETEPLADGDDVTLFAPEGLTGFMNYITVDANFDFGAYTLTDESGTAKPAGWLSISKIVTESEDEEEIESTITEYELKAVLPSSNPEYLEGDDVYIQFTEQTSGTTFRQKIVLPALKNYIKAERFDDPIKYNADGDVFNSSLGGYMEGAATGYLTSANNVTFVELAINERGFYVMDDLAENWIETAWEWEATTELISSNSVSISVKPSATNREGVVLALPEEVFDDVVAKTTAAGQGNDYSSIIAPDDIAEQYVPYIIANIYQEAEIVYEGDPIEQVEPSYWEMALAGFGTLPSDDEAAMMGLDAYQFTYTNSDVSYPLGTECEFDANFSFSYCEVYKDATSLMESKSEGRVWENGAETDLEYWVKLKSWGEQANRYYVEVTTKDTKAKSAYLVFWDAEGMPVALIKVVYDTEASIGGGDEEDLNLQITMMGLDYELTKIDADSPYYPIDYTGPAYTLTYTGPTSEAGMAVIGGFPEISFDSGTSWVVVEPMGAGQYSFMFDCAGAYDEASGTYARGEYTFFGMNYMAAVKIVCIIDPQE